MSLAEKFYFLAQAVLIFLNVCLGTMTLKDLLKNTTLGVKEVCNIAVMLFYFCFNIFFVLR